MFVSRVKSDAVDLGNHSIARGQYETARKSR